MIIDDGSTDDSCLIAKEYAEKNPSFHYYHKENGGLSAARNYGISLAKGKYLAFLDSDDKVADWIYRDMLYMAEKNQTPLTICNVTRLNEKGGTPVFFLYQKAFSGPPRAVSSIRQDPNLVYDTAVWNKLILRSFWDDNDLSFPEGRVYEDGPVSFRLHWYSDRVSVIHGFGYYYRIREGNLLSISQRTNSIKNLQDKLDMKKDVLSFLRERSEDPSAEELLLTQQKRILSMSIESTLLSLYLLDRTDQDLFISMIGSFLREEISEKALEKVSLYNNTKYRLLVSGDREGLLQLMNHKRLAWRSMPVIDLDGTPMLVLPEEIYKKSMTPAAKELQDDIPLTRITSIKKETDSINMALTVYYPRINVPLGSERNIKGFIYSEYTGEKVFLESRAIPSPELTTEKGTMICNDDFRVYEYDYDGAGIRMTIPYDTLFSLDTNGKWYLGIAYETSMGKGERLIRSIAPDAKRYIADALADLNPDRKGKGKKIQAKFDQRESFFFCLS
ncbi:MAG: glycosyltransferase [Saccharofermentans sp.]|nr:glycosyltransferase [Saccharofermentans sp.]